MLLTRKFIIGSLLFHISLIVATCIYNLFDHTIKKTVVVYGAHSRKPSHVKFRASKSKTPVPFVANGKKRKVPKKKKPVKKKQKKQAKKQKKEIKKLPPAKFRELKKEQKKNKKQKKLKPEPVKKEVEEEEEESLEEEIIEEKKEEKKIEEPKAPEEPKEEQIKEEVPGSEMPDATQPEQPTDETPGAEGTPNGTGNDDAIDIDLTETNNDNDIDVEIYRKHAQEEVDRHWKPPVGVAQGTVCRVRFQIDDKGKVSSAEYVTRSNIIIYDLSIMRIEKQLTFAPCLWGKKVTMDFKQ